MERLTNANHKEIGFYSYCGPQNPFKTPLTIGELAGFNADYSPRKILEDILGRLAAYEDTGLEPEAIEALKGRALMGALESPEMEEYSGSALQRADRLIEEYESLGGINHLREFAQAEKDGRLLVLPVKPDEIVYQWKKGDDIPSLFRLDGVNINEDGEITYQTHWGETLTPDDFGKTVFLTREEAEAALKNRGGSQ